MSKSAVIYWSGTGNTEADVYKRQALTVLRPWQSALIFTGNCLFLNLLLPYTPAGPDNFYSNAVNSCFVTLGAFFISLWFYRSKVSSRYAKIIIEQQNADIRSMNRCV